MLRGGTLSSSGGIPNRSPRGSRAEFFKSSFALLGFFVVLLEYFSDATNCGRCSKKRRKASSFDLWYSSLRTFVKRRDKWCEGRRSAQLELYARSNRASSSSG